MKAVNSKQYDEISVDDISDDEISGDEFPPPIINKQGSPGRPSMDILVRSWQDLVKILEKS